MTDYKGWDYSELFPALGLDPNGGEPETVKAITAMSNLTKTTLPPFAAEVRKYLAALIAVDHSHATPLWRGLCEIEDDETFVQFFIPLLRGAWS